MCDPIDGSRAAGTAMRMPDWVAPIQSVGFSGSQESLPRSITAEREGVTGRGSPAGEGRGRGREENGAVDTRCGCSRAKKELGVHEGSSGMHIAGAGWRSGYERRDEWRLGAAWGFCPGVFFGCRRRALCVCSGS